MAETEPQLKRAISLPLLIFYGLGTILGAGIYVLIGEVANSAGMYAPIAFMVAAGLAVCTAFSYAELASRFPRSAGEAVYLQEGFNRQQLSTVVGLLVILIGIVSSATIVNGFVGYLRVFVILPDWLVITTVVFILGGIAAWGIRESAIIAAVVTLVEIGGLLLIIWVARDSFTVLPTRLPEMLPPLNEGVWLGILLGAFLAFYAFIGFEDMVNVAEEVKAPSRTFPLAIAIVFIVTTVLYMLVALVSVLSLPLERLAGSDAPLAVIYSHVTGREPTLISVISMVSVINGVLIQIVMATRVLYGLSYQGWLPKQFSWIHPRTRTPLRATFLIVAVMLVFALWLPLTTLAKLTSYITLLVFALVNLSLWRVKQREPSPPGITCYSIWIPAIGFIVSFGFFVLQLILHF